jgi:hypothetical protein
MLQTRECGRSLEDGGGAALDQAPDTQFCTPKEKAARSTVNKTIIARATRGFERRNGRNVEVGLIPGAARKKPNRHITPCKHVGLPAMKLLSAQPAGRRLRAHQLAKRAEPLG